MGGEPAAVLGSSRDRPDVSQRDRSGTNLFRREALERLSAPERLDLTLEVIRPRAWIPIACIAVLLGLALTWAFLGRVPVTVVGSGVLLPAPGESGERGILRSVAYFALGDAARIEPGMAIQVIPDGVQRQRHGGLLGRVTSVGARPATLSGVAELVGGPELAGFLLSGALRIEVVADLRADPATPSGYAWSLARGPRLRLIPGTPTVAHVVVENRAPIAFVAPFLEPATHAD